MTTETDAAIHLSQTDIIGLSGAVATIVVAVITWLLSAAHTRKTMKRKELQYRMKITPLLNQKLFKEADKLEITYKDDTIEELVFLEIDIIIIF